MKKITEKKSNKPDKKDKHVALRIARQMPRGREETVSGRSGN